MSLRQQLRQQRRHLTSTQHQYASHKVCEYLYCQAFFQQAQHIGYYLANDGELDLTPLSQQMTKKTGYLPIVQTQPRHLYFAPYQMGDTLIPNRYHILEPDIPAENWATSQALDLLLMPLVAFDSAGHRLGMGGGYYDRTLAYKHAQPTEKPYLVGIAHAFQQVQHLSTNAWDIPLNAIITETGVHLIS